MYTLNISRFEYAKLEKIAAQQKMTVEQLLAFFVAEGVNNLSLLPEV